MQRLLDTTEPIPLEPLDPESVVAGEPQAGARTIAALADLEVGVWEITPGTATDIESDEVFVVLSGSATVSFDDGEVIELSAGSAVRLRAGDRTTWAVRETLRKVYIT